MFFFCLIAVAVFFQGCDKLRNRIQVCGSGVLFSEIPISITGIADHRMEVDSVDSGTESERFVLGGSIRLIEVTASYLGATVTKGISSDLERTVLFENVFVLIAMFSRRQQLTFSELQTKNKTLMRVTLVTRSTKPVSIELKRC